MPALPPYIPPRDADLDPWSANFSTLITATPATYGLTAGDATAIAGVVATWHADYLLITSPSTRTPSAIAAKNAAKIAMLATLRPYAVTISLNAGVSSANKIALGVNPRTSVPLPITTPTTYPVLTIASALALQHVVYYKDQLAAPSVKSKPYGAIAVQIFATASATPIVDPTLLQFKLQATKAPLAVTWPSGARGELAYYAARWVTRTGLVGPYGPIISFTVA